MQKTEKNQNNHKTNVLQYAIIGAIFILNGIAYLLPVEKYTNSNNTLGAFFAAGSVLVLLIVLRRALMRTRGSTIINALMCEFSVILMFLATTFLGYTHEYALPGISVAAILTILLFLKEPEQIN